MTESCTSKRDPVLVMDEAKAFAKKHVVECANELLARDESGILCDGRFRELARLCAHVVGGYSHGLTLAENFVHREALRIVADRS